jgi:hypothetical protein
MQIQNLEQLTDLWTEKATKLWYNCVTLKNGVVPFFVWN